MGYDRQRSPFATRLFLTCYCLFLLLNILLYSNNNYPINNNEIPSKDQLKLIFLCLISLFIFLISFYGLWFAKLIILCFIALLFSILLCISFISILLIITNLSSNEIFLLKTSLYFAHNYIWFIQISPTLFSMIYLLFSSLLNILALWGICHLCSCIEHRQESWPYRKTTPRISVHKERFSWI